MTKENPYFVIAQILATIAGFMMVASAMFNASTFDAFALHNQGIDTHYYLAEKCLENTSFSPYACNESKINLDAAKSNLDIAESAMSQAYYTYNGAGIIALFSFLFVFFGIKFHNRSHR